MRRGTHGPDLVRCRSHRCDRRDIRARLMHFLGVTETCDLGALYLRLKDEGHEVKVAISDPEAHGTLAGLVERVDDWRAELDWIRAAGRDGVILFESVSVGFGALQDARRADALQVIGGSAFGARQIGRAHV